MWIVIIDDGVGDWLRMEREKRKIEDVSRIRVY